MDRYSIGVCIKILKSMLKLEALKCCTAPLEGMIRVRKLDDISDMFSNREQKQEIIGGEESCISRWESNPAIR